MVEIAAEIELSRGNAREAEASLTVHNGQPLRRGALARQCHMRTGDQCSIRIDDGPADASHALRGRLLLRCNGGLNDRLLSESSHATQENSAQGE